MASLLGRILSRSFAFFVIGALLVTTPLQAAPSAAIVMDARTGEVLYERNAHTRLHPASLTKMMTLYIVFQEIEAGRLSLDTRVTVSKHAAAQPPSRLGLRTGQKISVRHLIRASAVKSANDAAAALGDAVSGDHVAFAKRMTRTARSLGMNNTTFKNAHGLTAEGHLSTAYDMNILGRHLFYDFPQYYNIFSRRSADAGIATVNNTNTRFLDNYEGADGIKTGFTSAAGFNLTASALRGNKRIIATVFGGTSTANRNARMAELMDIGFDKARNRVREQPPVAPQPVAHDALIAAAEPEIDEIDAVGGAGKTVRVSGAIASSLRPKLRPGAPAVPDAVALAMAESINGALAQAIAPPPPAGTLEFQAAAIATGEPVTEARPTELSATEPAAPEAVTPEASVVAETVAAVTEPATTAAPPEPGTLEAQAALLAQGILPVEAESSALPAVEAPADVVLAEVKPRARPGETTAEPAADAAPVDLAEGAAPELVVTDPGPEADAETQLAAVAPALGEALLAGVTAVEPVAAATFAAVTPDTEVATTRRAPIFDAIVPTAEAAAAPPEEVVVVMSTAGGRHYGVNVGEFPSRHDAERALLRTALAESATLNDGLRKTTQSDGAWRASFMGLTEDQAELACRRLRARAVPCETVGS